MDTDYERIVSDALQRYTNISIQCRDLEMEMTKLLQFIRATMNLLPDERRKQFEEAFADAAKVGSLKVESLSRTVKRVLRIHANEWLSVAEVRDEAVKVGFDFSSYSSNPLASVSTTLKRIEEKEPYVETKSIEGVAVYRWKGITQESAMRRRETLSGTTVKH